MSNNHSPVRGTVIMGSAAALMFIPLTMMFCFFCYWPKAFCLSLSVCISTYLFYLSVISGKKPGQILFPLILLFMTAVSGMTLITFILTSCMIFAWIRSGILFPEKNRLVPELMTSLPGAAALICFCPNSGVTWALCIFLFFLVQTFYFIFSEEKQSHIRNLRTRQFEQAKQEAEKILSGNFHL